MKIHGYGDINREREKVLRAVRRFEKYLDERTANKDYGEEVSEELLDIFRCKVADLLEIIDY